MLRSLVQVGRIEDVAQLLSPAFLRVFPMGRVLSAFRELAGNYRNADRFESVRDHRAQAIESSHLEIEIVESTDQLPPTPTEPSDGLAILELYFHQLFDGDPTLLDLGRDRFGRRDGSLVWAPSKLWIDWEDDFHDAICDLYGGFYEGDDERFRSALDRLDLGPAGDLFREHFGGDEQRNVEFDVETFRETFLKILRTCKESGVSLHEHFVPLGFYLVSLYNHLDAFHQRYDVRSAFHHAVDEG
jgi:hypothetical protein